MRIITLATQKGGSGKSTLAASLAVAAQADGLRVAVIDTDPQGTLAKWADRREAETPVVDTCEPNELAGLLAVLQKQGSFDLAIIDTAGAHNVSVAPAIERADFCLVPVRPIITDIEAAIPTAKQLKDRRKPFAFVLSQAFGSVSRTNEAATSLLQYGAVANGNVFQRADYADANGFGLGVTEFNPKGKAAQEIKLLWAWLRRTIGETNHDQARAPLDAKPRRRAGAAVRDTGRRVAAR